MKETKTRKSRYIIRRAFDEYKAGDEFIPTGNFNDPAIIEHYCDLVYNELEVCVTCGKEFKQLRRHKCKGGK